MPLFNPQFFRTMMFSKYFKLIVINLSILALFLAFIEIALRFQTDSELEYTARDMDFSNYLHHSEAKSADKNIHGECNNKIPLTALFLGDSWVAGGEIVDSVSKNLATLSGKYGRCIQSVNAGVSSYSPSLYLLKARKIFTQETILPDFVFINIDETDLMDEWLRYRDVSIRDDQNRLIAVTGAREQALEMMREGFLSSMNQYSSYTVRLLKREILRSFVDELKTYGYDVRPTYHTLLAPQMSSTPMHTFVEPVRYFTSRIQELIAEITAFGVKKQNIFVTYHPHFLGVLPESDSTRYNSILPDVLSKALKEVGVAFYDSTADMHAMHGKGLAQKFLWPDDKFSHLTSIGYTEYGKAIFLHFYQELNSILTENIDPLSHRE